MKYKLIAIDMDGTILNSKNQLSQRTKKTLYKAKEKGVHIVLSTGRILRSALHYSKLLDIKDPVIASNGAVVVDETYKIIYKKTLDKKAIRDLDNIAKENNMYYHFYDESFFYSRTRVQQVLDFYNEGDSQLNIEMKIFEDIDKLLDRQALNVYKFLFVEEDLSRLNRFREKISSFENINISSSWSNNVEAMALDVSKGQALKKLCSKLRIKSEEVIAIGDSENDLSMFDFAGLSVAMGNSTNEIKNKVNYVTDSNDNDGVAKTVEKFLFEQES